MTTDGTTDNPITVGFDGSPAGLSALRWAVAFAQSTGSELQVVTAYASKGGESINVARMNAEAVVNLATHEGADDTDLVRLAIPGEPTEVLLKCSEDSRLLVVGRHGTSGMIHSSLGSVGDACARLASCPVVIVPPVASVTA
ncbi:MAG: universal stress protein [Actinomycetota bacterium]|nr:universal stress protein [Actinomycetota bacterium]